MKKYSLALVAGALALTGQFAGATQADDTTITITAQNAGPTDFVEQLTLSASSTATLKSIQFTIASKPGAHARALSGTYSLDYMISKGYLTPPSTEIFLPVYGLYADFTNTVTLTYHFLDGSSKTDRYRPS